jgi:hypothetical protein
MTDKETLKLALDDLMVEYDMERTSFAKRVDEIFKQAPPEQPSPVTSLQALALDKMAENARELGLDYEPAQQEPVAWMQDSIELYVQDRPSANYTIPLYTTPPAAHRTWVGLKDPDFSGKPNTPDFIAGAFFAEAILKEKNT